MDGWVGLLDRFNMCYELILSLEDLFSYLMSVQLVKPFFPIFQSIQFSLLEFIFLRSGSHCQLFLGRLSECKISLWSNINAAFPENNTSLEELFEQIRFFITFFFLQSEIYMTNVFIFFSLSVTAYTGLNAQTLYLNMLLLC